MKNKGRIIFILVVVILSFIARNYFEDRQTAKNEKIIKENIKKIEKIANDYYTNLIDGNYEEALRLVNYENSTYMNDLKWLEEHPNYKITMAKNNKIMLEIRYDKTLGKYTGYSLIDAHYGDGIYSPFLNAQGYKSEKHSLNERFYFIEKNGKFYIDSIGSKDIYVNIRSDKNQQSL